MADFTLRQLTYFVGIAEAGSISDAALRLHVSASALAAALTDLESSVGAALFIRRKAHGVTLTPNGLAVLDQARLVLRAADEIRHVSDLPDHALRGPVTLGCYLSLAPTIVPRILDEIGRQHPDITLNLVEATQDALLRGLDDGQIDLAAVYDMQLAGRLNRVLLHQVRMHILLPADHPLAAEPSVRLEQLADEPFVLLDAQPSQEHTLGVFQAAGFHPLIGHRTSSYEMVRSLVARGLGWSVLVQRPANDLSYEGLPLVMKEISPAPAPVGVYVVWPESSVLTVRAKAIIDCVLGLDWPNPAATAA